MRRLGRRGEWRGGEVLPRYGRAGEGREEPPGVPRLPRTPWGHVNKILNFFQY